MMYFFFSSRRRHTRLVSDWSSDVCSSDLKRRWDVAVQDNDNAHYKTTAYFGRSAEPFAGAGCRIAPAFDRRRSNKARSASRSEERRVGKECTYGWQTRGV